VYDFLWSSIETIALNCLVFEKIAFLQFGDRQTDEQMDTPVAWSRSRCRLITCVSMLTRDKNGCAEWKHYVTVLETPNGRYGLATKCFTVQTTSKSTDLNMFNFGDNVDHKLSNSTWSPFCTYVRHSPNDFTSDYNIIMWLLSVYWTAPYSMTLNNP